MQPEKQEHPKIEMLDKLELIEKVRSVIEILDKLRNDDEYDCFRVELGWKKEPYAFWLEGDSFKQAKAGLISQLSKRQKVLEKQLKELL